MLAYKIAKVTRQSVVAECRYELPYVHCDLCQREWGEGLIQFPMLNPPFLREAKFRKRIVDVEGFNEIKSRIAAVANPLVNLVPGSSYGPLEGKSDKLETSDFLWGSICVPQISRRGRDLMRHDCVQLRTAEARILYGRKKLDYFAIQPELTPMLTQESCQEARISFCRRCGDYFQNYPCPNMQGCYKLQRNAWPQGAHLVQLMETLEVIASEAFMDSVARNHLSGIRFVEYGQFV